MALTEITSLVGRDPECERIAAFVCAVRDGTGGALRVEGPPGVGKSALLELAATLAGDLPVLRAAGTELETDIPWAGLDALLDASDTQHDPAALLRDVAARLAGAAPVLVLVDDVQWLDASSRTAVAYLARRSRALGIGLLAAWSERGAVPDPWPDAEILPVGELDRRAALTLAERQGLTPAVSVAFVDAVGGSPLALTDGPRALTAEQRAGRVPLPPLLPAGPRLQTAYAARVDALPEDTREALLLAAAGAPAALVATALEPAEDDGLVTLGQAEVRFAHPLVRSAVYHAAAPSRRREAHRRIAASSTGTRRAWQLALATPGPDSAIADALEAAAATAGHAGAPGTAATLLERAARLTPDSGGATQRLVLAAAQGLTAGRAEWALGLLDELLPGAGDPGARADVQALRGMAMYQSGRSAEAAVMLEAEAGAVAATDPGRASALLSHACVALMGPGPVPRIVDLARRALDLADGNPLAAVLEAEGLVCLGDHARARAALDQLEPGLAGWDPTAPGHEVLAMAALCRIYLGDFDLARASLLRVVESNRAAGAVAPLAMPLAVLSTLQMRAGDLDGARRSAAEAAAIADTGLAGGFVGTLTLAAQAMVAAHRGDEAACRVACDRMLALGAELPVTLGCAEQALGLLALSRGDAHTAAGHLERARAHTAEHGTRDPAFLMTEPDLVEAYVRCDRRAEAEAVLAALTAGAERTGGAWAAAATRRCRGLLEGVDRIPHHLAAALEHHAAAEMPLETARTRLALGEALRRGRRPAIARGELEAARDAFRAAGARLWAERAERELAAAGGGESGPEDLTARETDVCRLVATGASNQEIAAALFLSRRTVEHHLRIAFRKLDVKTRGELAARWRDVP